MREQGESGGSALQMTGLGRKGEVHIFDQRNKSKLAPVTHSFEC